MARKQSSTRPWLFGRLGWALMVACVSALGRLHADEQGDSAIVVFNSNLPESKALADYYAARRRVPANQVFGLDLPSTESITRQQYQDRLRAPLLNQLASSKLMAVPRLPGGGGAALLENGSRATPSEAKIRYAVLCYGVPLRIDEDSKLKEDHVEKLPVQLRKNEASVDSELALLPVRESRVTLHGPFPNPSYAATNGAFLHPTNGVLMVARLDGPSAEIARGLIDKAIQAEAEGLWGRAYFDARGLTNGIMKLGDDWIRGAAEVTRRLGYETVLDTKEERFPASFPMSQIAFYAGWYEHDGQVSGPFTQPVVEFMPGAFAYHLHSFSAASVRNARQHWVGPLLEKGATATMGCVHEPYLEFTPNLAIFFHRLLTLGFSFGEAAYASHSYLSWQTTFVGDPLYRPFARSPRKLHEELFRSQSRRMEWWHLKVVNMNLVADLPADELIGYLDEVPEIKDSAVLLEKLGDLHAAKSNLPRAIAAYRRAAQIATSSQQKLRLMLVLGQTLESTGAANEAWTLYWEFARSFPEYADLAAIFRRLLSLAEQLKRPEEMESIQKEIDRLTSSAGPKL